MLAAKEICKVRRDAYGSNSKAYNYAIVEQNFKTSARVTVLNWSLNPYSTFLVKHKFLWKLKAAARRPLERKLAHKRGASWRTSETQAIMGIPIEEVHRLMAAERAEGLLHAWSA